MSSVRVEMKDRSMFGTESYIETSRPRPGMSRGGLVVGLIILLASLVSPEVARSQEPPPVWLVATGDTVLVQIARPPMNNYGFVVDRIGPEGEVRLTESPVFPVRSPGLAASLLGEDLPRVLELLETTDELQLLRRLQADAFTAGVSSILFRRVAFVLGRLYADTTVQAGTSYEYRVTFLDEVGEETTNTLSARLMVADRLPAAPTGLEGSAGNAEARISWRYDSPYDETEDFVLGFRVERAVGTGDFRPLGEVPILRTEKETQEFVDHNVNNGLSYRYRVRAIDLAGRESEPSNVATIAPLDDRAPSAPQNLTTEPGEGRVRLSWRISPESNIVGYHVERSRGLDQPYTRLTNEPVPTLSPTWIDQGVPGGIQYFYRVIALNDQGVEGRPSNPISAVPTDRTPPEPPLEVEAVVVDKGIRVRWSASPSDDVRGYHIYRGESAGVAVRLTERPQEGLEYIDRGFGDEGLRPGGRYTIRVSAVDHSANESSSVETTVQVPDDEPPATPTALQLRNVEGHLVELSWSAGGSLDVESYRVTRTTLGTGQGGGTIEIGTIPASGRLRLRDDGVETGVEYRYQLTAIDSAGNISEPVEASLLFKRLAAPPSTRRVVARVVEGGVQVSWERVVDDELTGYRVYRSTISTGIYEPVSELVSADEPLVFTDRGGSREHYYQVRAVDRSGNESKPSPSATAGPS